MLHIILLNRSYFPDRLQKFGTGDKVVVIALISDAIPVVAYQRAAFKDMEVKLLPEIKDTTSAEGKNALRIAQAMLIGQLTASIKDFEIYTDDNVLLKVLTPFTGKKPSAKKKASTKTIEVKNESVVEAVAAEKAPKDIPATVAKKSKKAEAKKTEKTGPKDITQSDNEKKNSPVKDKAEKNAPNVNRADIKTRPAKLPTQAEVKRVLGAANSSYAKPIMEVIKKSNQITFEMDLRMKLVEAGMDASQCQELAKSINEEFGKSLPASM